VPRRLRSTPAVAGAFAPLSFPAGDVALSARRFLASVLPNCEWSLGDYTIRAEEMALDGGPKLHNSANSFADAWPRSDIVVDVAVGVGKMQ
jgi:hypothetical protein